ncbi:hypothetical protein [Aliikangiella sp. IMCC44359]
MTDPLIEKIFNSTYQIESILADGGMGVVYIAPEQISGEGHIDTDEIFMR